MVEVNERAPVYGRWCAKSAHCLRGLELTGTLSVRCKLYWCLLSKFGNLIWLIWGVQKRIQLPSKSRRVMYVTNLWRIWMHIDGLEQDCSISIALAMETLQHSTKPYTRYHKTSNISGTLVRNKIVDHSDVVGASPVGAAPTTSSFST